MRDLSTRFAVALALVPAVALLVAPAASARSERLRWSHAEPERVAGFRAQIGYAPDSVALSIDLPGAQPDESGIYSARIEDLPEELTLYVAMIAYDSEGRESRRSNEREALADRDGDTVPNDADNCPDAPNALQRDPDQDGVGGVCDNCAFVPNPRVGTLGIAERRAWQVVTGGQSDQDADGIGDACDCDLDQSGVCTVYDLVLLLEAAKVGAAERAGGDRDGSGTFTISDFEDFARQVGQLYGVPGPSCASCPLLCEGPRCPAPQAPD